MPVLHADPARIAPPSPRTVAGLLAAAGLIAAGVWLGVQELTTDLLALVALRASPGAGSIVAIVVWGIGLLAPVVLILVGSVRLGRIYSRRRRTRTDRLLRLAAELPDDHVVALGVALPDGRRLPALVVTPDAIAILSYLPPPGAIRFVHGRCEARIPGAGWTPIEEPLTRCRRDADGARRWLHDAAAGDLLTVHAAVIDEAAPRTPPYPVTVAGVELIGPADLRSFIGSLQGGQRLTPGRFEAIVERIRAAIV